MNFFISIRYFLEFFIFKSLFKIFFQSFFGPKLKNCDFSILVNETASEKPYG